MNAITIPGKIIRPGFIVDDDRNWRQFNENCVESGTPEQGDEVEFQVDK